MKWRRALELLFGGFDAGMEDADELVGFVDERVE